MKLAPEFLGPCHVGEDVVFGTVHKVGEFGQFGPELIGDLAPLHTGCGFVGLGESGADVAGDHRRVSFADMSQGVALEVDAAPLPCCTQDFGNRGLQDVAQEGSFSFYLNKAHCSAGETNGGCAANTSVVDDIIDTGI